MITWWQASKKKKVLDLLWKWCQLLLLLENTIGGAEVSIMRKSWLEVSVELIISENYFSVNEVRETACNAFLIHFLAGTALKCLWHTFKH